MKFRTACSRNLPAAFVIAVAAAACAQGAQNSNTISTDPQDWPMYNYDSFGTRCNRGENILSTSTVHGLHEKWRFWTAGDVYATPAVVDNTVYFGDSSGVFYAVSSNGRLIWQINVAGPVTASALVANNVVVFGDLAGYIYGVERGTGVVRWHVHPNPSGVSRIWGSATSIGNDVVIGIGSNEKFVNQEPGFRGSVVRINPEIGSVIWQTFLVTAEEAQAGASGAGVWSTPTYDPGSGLVYVSTGNSYTPPASHSSDAVLALDAGTGDIKWSYQATSADVGQTDQDFGDSPHLYSVGDHPVIGIGQKSGRFFVLDAANGKSLNSPLQVVPECHDSNGLFATGAVVRDHFYAPGQNCKYPFGSILPTPTGQLTAIKYDGSGTFWQKITLFENATSGVAVANGVIYYSTVGLSGNLLAVDAETGKTLANVFIGWGVSGPSVSRGQVYVGTGTKFAAGVYTPPSLVALGL
jgi:polyvinyl alcohol dehydrogenase (cytochrome)